MPDNAKTHSLYFAFRLVANIANLCGVSVKKRLKYLLFGKLLYHFPGIGHRYANIRIDANEMTLHVFRKERSVIQYNISAKAIGILFQPGTNLSGLTFPLKASHHVRV